MLCETCPQFTSCTNLCSAAAKFVAQDHARANTRRVRWLSLDHLDRFLNDQAVVDWRHPADGAPANRFDLSGLSITQRLIIEYIYYDGLSTRQTSRRLGLSQSGVLRKLQRALTLLRQRAGRHELGEGQGESSGVHERTSVIAQPVGGAPIPVEAPTPVEAIDLC